MSLPASKPTRNADYRHAQSLGRQRKNTTAPPRQQAEAIAKIVRKKISDQQAVPDLDRYGLNDQVWAELLDSLTADELSTIADACGADDLDDSDNEPSADDLTMAFGDVPMMPEPPASQQVPDVTPSHTPSWRDHEPPIVHSLKWKDADAVEHLHVIRADDLDEALRYILKVKLCIKAAQLKAQKACDTAQISTTDSEPVLSSRRCELHDAPMVKAISRKTGRPYASHMTADGERCFGRKA